MTPPAPVHGDLRFVDSVPVAFGQLLTAELSHSRSVGQARFSLFLSGGPTAEAAYLHLATIPIDWSNVDVYWGDERFVPLDHPDSNHRMVTESLHAHLDTIGSIHPMYRELDPTSAAASYQNELAHLDAFDLVHLGIGPDGHTASLFPESAALTSTDSEVWVMANADPKLNNPHQRITLTMAGIARARLVVFTVDSPDSAQAVARIAAGEDLPAGRVTAERMVWLVDSDLAHLFPG